MQLSIWTVFAVKNAEKHHIAVDLRCPQNLSRLKWLNASGVGNEMHIYLFQNKIPIASVVFIPVAEHDLMLTFSPFLWSMI